MNEISTGWGSAAGKAKQNSLRKRDESRNNLRVMNDSLNESEIWDLEEQKLAAFKEHKLVVEIALSKSKRRCHEKHNTPNCLGQT